MTRENERWLLSLGRNRAWEKKRLKTSSGWNSCQGSRCQGNREITTFACNLCTSLLYERFADRILPLFNTFLGLLTHSPASFPHPVPMSISNNLVSTRFNCQRIIAQVVQFFFYWELRCLVGKLNINYTLWIGKYLS